MPSGMPSIRRAALPDARLIAETHVQARRSAYRGLIPEALLAAESVEKRETLWRRRLADPEGRCWVVGGASAPWGFLYTAPAGDEGLGDDCAEIYSLYLLEERRRQGLGRMLTQWAMSDLEARGFSEAVLWVAQENQAAVGFYTAAGFEPDPRASVIPFGDTGLHRLRMRSRVPGVGPRR